MNLKSVIDLQMILKILYRGARLNFMFSLPQLHTKSLCVLALQNSQFEASTSSRPQTVNFEALGHKAIYSQLHYTRTTSYTIELSYPSHKCIPFSYGFCDVSIAVTGGFHFGVMHALDIPNVRLYSYYAFITLGYI